MKFAAALILALVLAGCAHDPATDTATTPRSPAGANRVCVVSMDGDGPGCPETPVASPTEDDEEPCVERVADDAFTHGPGARLYAFCTPAQAARKAVAAARSKGKEWPGVPR